MLAMNFRGPCRIRAEQKSAPYIEHFNDAIVRVNQVLVPFNVICGSCYFCQR